MAKVSEKAKCVLIITLDMSRLEEVVCLFCLIEGRLSSYLSLACMVSL